MFPFGVFHSYNFICLVIKVAYEVKLLRNRDLIIRQEYDRSMVRKHASETFSRSVWGSLNNITILS